LRAWCVGQDYKHKGTVRRYHKVIELDGAASEGLSFLNLVEAPVLIALRRFSNVPLPKIRDALKFVSRELGLSRPLAEAQFATVGVKLYVEQVAGLLDVDKRQYELREIVDAYLRRVERNPAGVPIKLYPFTRKDVTAEAPGTVVMDPTVQFGRPVLVGTRVPTAVLADRFKAGDSLEELADDYGTSSQAIEEAIRCELDRREAA
jgi:uncharacterized protein (DUF433 family)